MEAISKLYAEIGFKVDKKGLTEFSNLLSDVQKQIQSFSKNIREIPGLDIKSSGSALQASRREDARKEREEKRKQKEKERENKRFERSLERISNQLVKGLGGLFVFALSAAKKLVGAAADGSSIAMGMKDFSLVTGGNIEDLMQWTSLGSAVGGNAEQVKKMMQGLSSRAAQLRLGQGGAADTFKMLGLAGITEPSQMMGELLGAIRGHTVDEAVMSELLSALGLDPALTKKMAYATDKQLERAELLYKLTPEQTEVMKATLFREDLTSIADALDSAKVKLASAFNDVDPEFINNILKSLDSEEFKNALEAFATLIIGAVKGIANAVKWIYDAGGKMGEFFHDSFQEGGLLYMLRKINGGFLTDLIFKPETKRNSMTQINGGIQIVVDSEQKVGPVMSAIQEFSSGDIITDTTRSFGDISLGGVNP